MAAKKKIGFFTKVLSHRKYLNEVPVEGKTTPFFFFHLKYFDKYASQIIRTGNCITLLSNKMAITIDNFFNTVHFENIVRFVFWTFNKSFLLKLEDKVQSLTDKDLFRCAELLEENLDPYTIDEDETDEELLFCDLKLKYLRTDQAYSRMFSLDQQNRAAVLLAIKNQIALLPSSVLQDSRSEPANNGTSIPLPFLEIVKPINGNPEATLQLIKTKMEEAGFDCDLFVSIKKLPNGKNPYGLNGRIAAMIDFFYQNNYFKKEYSLEQIFLAYFHFSGNNIGKFKVFLSEFREDNYYLKYFGLLKSLKINKMQE